MPRMNTIGAAQSRAISLVLIMLISSLAAANLASASTSRQYTTERDPHDVALGDFDCDGDLDIVTANDQSLKISVLWNDDGHFYDRMDIWTSSNTSEDATYEDHSNTQQVEVGDFTGDGNPDIVIYARNRPFKSDGNGGLIVDKLGNITTITNDGGCDSSGAPKASPRGFSIGARIDQVWVWDLAVGDVDEDGDDDILVLELQADIKKQVVKTYMAPITSSFTPTVDNPQLTQLGDSTANAYRELEVGDWGETQGIGQTCTDLDIWLQRSEGVDYLTGVATNPGSSDNVTVIEFDCLSKTFPTSYAFSTQQQPGSHVHALGVDFGGMDIGDVDGNGIVDVVAMNDGNTQNVTYALRDEATGVYSASQKVYFGEYISWEVTITDLNGDGEPDFLNACKFGADESTDSTGQTTTIYYLNEPTSIAVTLSNGNGGHMAPLYYGAAARPSTAVVGQLIGGASSAPDIVLAHGNYRQTTWNDNWGWDGAYERIIVIEMDNTDLAVSDIDFSHTDKYIGSIGEGARSVNVTVTNTGMGILNGQADLTVEIKEVDEAASTNQTVFSADWDSADDATGCNGGCSWRFEAYHGTDHWQEETTHNTGVTGTGNNGAAASANSNNPTDFMWDGTMETDSNGDDWSGYGANWDEAMVLENVDLTGSDRAWISAELFRHMGFAATTYNDGQGDILHSVWDDMAMIEVLSDKGGWNVISCSSAAYFGGDCPSGVSMWGGYDNERVRNQRDTGNAEAIYQYWTPGIQAQGTDYGWTNFSESGVGAFDISTYAGSVVDIRFRFKSGFRGSNSDDDDSRWSGRDGFAVDNVNIWKQVTAFTTNVQSHPAQINMNNMAPNDEYTTSIQADFVNGTTYRISATLDGSGFGDEQPINDELIGFVTVDNLFDPAMVSFSTFLPGDLYAEDLLPIDVEVENWGNSAMDFEVKATIYSALPTDVYCATPAKVCDEQFELDLLYSDDNNQKGQIFDESTCNTQGDELIFGSNAYWFGHPCDTANFGYGDVWENESFTIPDIDLTAMSGDFVALNFEYYADTYYQWDSDGNLYTPGDYSAITLDWDRSGNNYEGQLIGQWVDYNNDGTCRNDDDGDGFVNSSESIDQAEIELIGDQRNINGGRGNFAVFFNSDGLVMSRSIDLTHIYVYNRTNAISNEWDYECLSLEDSVVDINFQFQSNDDGKNGQNNGLKGIGFDNISLQEFTFSTDAEYTKTVSALDADETRMIEVAEHDFFDGVYKIEVETIFDNTQAGTSWFGHEEISEANNIDSVIFTVKSVEISLSNTPELGCLSDNTLECVLPRDDILTHDWQMSATNGVLEGEYDFYMTVYDLTNGEENQVEVFNQTSGQSRILEPHERITVTYTPWNGYQDGKSYNITYFATLADTGEMSGNVRSFRATFSNEIDVAILGDDSSRIQKIKMDLDILEMTYTQFTINDWNTYLESGWMSHYDKILMPWQDDHDAKPSDLGGKGYYQKLGTTASKAVLEDFTNAGGTLQIHLSPSTNYYEYSSSTSKSLLPFNMDLQPRSTPSTYVTYNNMEMADPYHPLVRSLNHTSFSGFTSEGIVASSVLNTKSVSATSMPSACGGYMELGGQFQRIIRSEAEPADTVLATCSYNSGGVIVSTIDVTGVSDRANIDNFPLLGNMLQHLVTPYPTGFGILNSGTDITINGDLPELDSSTGGYKYHYMKSNATITFGYNSLTSATLNSDWVMSGPTGWLGNSLASGIDVTDSTNPAVTFCKYDANSPTGCNQGATWNIKLYLHDDAGHTRTLSLTVKTDDTRADEFHPLANFEINMGDEAIQVHPTKPEKVIGTDAWQMIQIKLSEDNLGNIPITVNFDASDSNDPDSTVGSGIVRYDWKVLFDAPYGDEDYDLGGHTYTKYESSGGLFNYTFQNITVNSAGTIEQEIRVDLVVHDKAGYTSSTYRMFFVVVPEGFGDEEPTFQYQLKDEDDKLINDKGLVDTDTITIYGTVIAGAEAGDVIVEVALNESDFNQNRLTKDDLKQLGLWAKSDSLGDGDTFELTLDISSLYTNVSRTQVIYILTYEGDDKRWRTVTQIEINLPICQGIIAPAQAEAAGGNWVLDSDDECTWKSDADNGWTYNSDTGEFEEPIIDNVAGAAGGGDMLLYLGGGGAILLIIILSLFFVLKGGDDDDEKVHMGFDEAVQQMDPMEQYVQQLIAQGYPEETARAYAQQYAGHFQQQ